MGSDSVFPADPAVQALVQRLGLQPHPEGGWYAEVHRAAATVLPADGRGPRSALTSIYFLLAAGEHSRWHRVASDEVWIHLEGAPLRLQVAEADVNQASAVDLGPLGAGLLPQHTVPAGHWQAARSLGAYSLVACVVGPGFDFADFELQ